MDTSQIALLVFMVAAGFAGVRLLGKTPQAGLRLVALGIPVLVLLGWMRGELVFGIGLAGALCAGALAAYVVAITWGNWEPESKEGPKQGPRE